MSDSVEVQLARVDEQLKMVLRNQEKDAERRKEQYEKNEARDRVVAEINTRLKSVEDTMNTQKPTIEEFITIKHKVVGAGKLGKWLWIAGAFLLGSIANLREYAIKLFGG